MDRLTHDWKANVVERFPKSIDDEALSSEALCRCQDLFRIIVDGAYDWEYWLAPDGRLLYVSSSCQRITGCSSQQFLENPDLIVSITDPRDRERMRQHLLAEGSEGDVDGVEFRIITPSGEVRWIEHVCRSVFDQDGLWLGRRASNRDVTRRKLAEMALAGEKRLLRTLIDNMPEAVYVKDDRGRFVLANRAVANMMGAASPELLLGRTDFDYYPPSLAQRFRDDEERIMASGQPLLNQEEPGMAVAGEGRRVSTSKAPLVGKDGAVIGIIGVGRDVTPVHEMAETLRRRNQVLELLNRANQALISTLDPEETVQTVIKVILRALDASGCSIWLHDSRTDELVCRHIVDPEGEVVHNWRLPPGVGIAGAVFDSGRSLIVPDTRLDPRHYRGVDQRTGHESRTILSVPLKVQDRTIGVVQVVDSRPNRFLPTDMQVLEALATTASVAIHNARLYQDTDSLRRFNQNIVERMDEGIVVEDAEGFIQYANPKSLAMLGRTDDDLLGKHWREIVAPEAIPQIELEAARRRLGHSGLYEIRLRRRDGGYVPTIVSAVPLLEGGNFAGTLSVHTDITDRKSAEEVLEQRNQDLELLNRASRSLISSLDLAQMLRQVLDEMRRGLDATAASAWLTDSRTGELVCWQSVGPHREQLIGWRLSPGQGVAGWVAERGSEIVVADTRADPRHYKEIDSFTGVECRSVLAVPLALKDTIIGVIELADSNPNSFSRSDLRLITSMAPTAAIAIENARLHQRAEEAAALEERQRLARDLHDSVTQSLYSLVLQSEGYRRMTREQDKEQIMNWFGELSETALQTLKEMRLLLFELRPVTLREQGLREALTQRLEGVERKLGIQVDLVMNGSAQFSSLVEEEVFRIVQEALNNAVKHSGSDHILVRLEREDASNQVEVEVTDNGIGFDTDHIVQGMGLDNMRERASRLGGVLHVESQPGAGTRILLQLAD